MTYFRWFEKTAFSLISSFCLISICCNGIVQSSKDDPVQLQDPKIVILGSTGVGKSSLANVLIGASPDCENCTFPICDGSDSCTKETSFAEANWLGEGDPFTVVDTPGFGDSDDEDNELIDEMVDALKNQINTTNVFLLSFNAEDDRMSSNTNQMLREMEALFGYSFWDNTVLEATHWAYDAKSVADRDYEGHDEEWWTNDKNAYLRKKFHLDHNLTAVFVDSYAKHGRNVEDEDQQIAFDRETAKLWELTNQLPSFPFKTLEDVLADLDECRRTIETDIADLQKEMEQVKKNITSVEGELENEISDREDEIKRVDGRISDEQIRAAGQEDQIRDWMHGNDTSLRKEDSRLDGEVENIEQSIEKFKSTPRFIVVRNSGGYVPAGKLTFSYEDVDSTNSFSSGVFRAPIEGTYLFQFSCETYCFKDASIDVYLNGVRHRHFADSGPDSFYGSYRQFTFYFTIKMEKFDELYLFSGYESSFYTDYEKVMTFMGMRLAD